MTRFVEFTLEQDAILVCPHLLVEVPDDVEDVEAFVIEHVNNLDDDSYYEVDWDSAAGLRIGTAYLDGQRIITDRIVGKPTNADNGYAAKQAIEKHWEVLSRSLPEEVLADLKPLMMKDA